MNQLEFFPELGILEWLPDETLFSLASRYHRLSGNRDARTTCLQLFGNGRASTSHDFPSGLKQFESRTRGKLGTIESILHEHTVLPYYLRFRCSDLEDYAIETLGGSNRGEIKSRLGMLASGVGANNPLKTCRLCLEEDKAKYGVSYWHRSHQLPGSWICLEHRIFLNECNEKSNGVQRFSYLLPKYETTYPVGRALESLSEQGLEAFISLAKMERELTALPMSIKFEASKLSNAYFSKLQQSGYTKGQLLQHREISSHCRSALCELTKQRDLDKVFSSSDWPISLMRPASRQSHPLKHLMLISWLFSTSKEFCEYYVRGKQINVGSTFEEDADASKYAYFSELINDGTTRRDASRVCNISANTARLWTIRMGGEIKRKPKILVREKEKLLVADLKSGLSKDEISQRLQISKQLITRYMQANRAVSDLWHDMRRQDARTKAREGWMKLMSVHPLASVTELRKINLGVYGWLYRNDRAWLDGAKEKSMSSGRPGGRLVDWKERDSVLAATVQKMALELGKERGNERIARWELCKRIPELRKKLDVLDRLPLTTRAIEIAIRRNPTDIAMSMFGETDDNP